MFLGDMLYRMNILSLKDFLPEYSVPIFGLIVGFLFYLLLSTYVVSFILKKMSVFEEMMVKMSMRELIASVLGTLIGLGIANLVGIAFYGFGIIGTSIVIVLNIIFAYMGFRVARRKKDEVDIGSSVRLKDKKSQTFGRAKILDTSVIIDGRILDLLDKQDLLRGK